MNEKIVKWINAKGITLSVNTKINTTFFADDQIIIADSQDSLQRGLFTSKNIAKDFGIDASPGESETMASLGQDPVRCKIIVDNKCVQQVKNFKYTVSEKDCTLFLFFIFFLGAQCVESGVSCTDCY